MFFKKKKSLPPPMPKRKKEEEMTINFNSSHDCFQRAETLFKSINLVDNGRLSNSMARGIKIYMDLDEKARNHSLTNPNNKESDE